LTQGQLDSPLTDRGREQAVRCAYELRMESICTVVSSPLGRALASAQVIASELALAEPVVESRFAERNEGMLQGESRAQQRMAFPHIFGPDGELLLDAAIPQAEPFEEFVRRVVDGVAAVSAYDGNTLVVCHAGPMQIVDSLIRSEKPNDWRKFRRIPLCGILRYKPR